MTMHDATRRSMVLALSTFLLGATLSVVVSAIIRPADAREFEGLVVVKDSPTFAQFTGIPESLRYPRAPDPDFCRSAAYCDTIPVRIPRPDVSADSAYKLVFKAGNTDEADLDVFFWDNKQLKTQFGKCPPGETCYDPLESDYTNILAISDPQAGGPTGNGAYEVAQPDLVDYNITVLNTGGTSAGYTIYMELKVEEFVPPTQVQPPDNSTSFTQTGSFAVGTSPTPATPKAAGPAVGDPTDLPTLNDLLIERDPDLQAIQEQNLADQLKAPTSQISQLGQVEAGPPAPVSGLTLLAWLAVMPAGVVGGAATVVQRRRVQIPDLG